MKSHDIERRGHIVAADVGIMNLQKKLCHKCSVSLLGDGRNMGKGECSLRVFFFIFFNGHF